MDPTVLIGRLSARKRSQPPDQGAARDSPLFGAKEKKEKKRGPL